MKPSICVSQSQEERKNYVKHRQGCHTGVNERKFRETIDSGVSKSGTEKNYVKRTILVPQSLGEQKIRETIESSASKPE